MYMQSRQRSIKRRHVYAKQTETYQPPACIGKADRDLSSAGMCRQSRQRSIKRRHVYAKQTEIYHVPCTRSDHSNSAVMVSSTLKTVRVIGCTLTSICKCGSIRTHRPTSGPIFLLNISAPISSSVISRRRSRLAEGPRASSFCNMS